MRLFKSFLAMVAFTIICIAAQAQSVDEILKKHFDALGGIEKIRSIKTISIESDIEVMGNTAPMRMEVLDGKGYKNTVTMNGSDIIQAITDTSGWMLNPMTGNADTVPMSKDQFESSKSQIYIGGPLLDYTAKGNKVELDGKEGNLFKLKVTDATPFSSVFFIGLSNYYYH